jgi:hypothetical protein
MLRAVSYTASFGIKDGPRIQMYSSRRDIDSYLQALFPSAHKTRLP